MSDDDRRALNAILNVLRRNTHPAAALTINLDVLALEILTALKGIGFKQTNAGRHQPWQPPQPGEALGPDIVQRCAEQVRQALTEALERAAQLEGTHAATRGDTHD